MRKQIAAVLRWQAKRYIKKNKPKIIVITGSVGKTSTTQAIATVLQQAFRVRATLKNYNTDLGVPCSIFGRELPGLLKNPFAWLWMMIKNEFTRLRPAPFELLVLELGTDVPGEIAEFAWLRPDLAVVTAVAPEHMEQFKTLEAVAREELAVAAYSEKTIINHRMVPAEYLTFADTEELYNYERSDLRHLDLAPSDLQVAGDHSLDAVSAGLAVGRELGMQPHELIAGAKAVRSQKGRMNLLAGINGSTLVDDTYNSSPEAVIAALDYLYSVSGVQRIALLGNMNELGDTSIDEHGRIGEHCDAKRLDLVVTLGPDANAYTAAAAMDNGCHVAEAQTPYEAADIIKRQMKSGAYVLLKGSQNGVFAEEAVKKLLARPEDEKELVRQSQFWLKKKQQAFSEETK